MTPNEDDLTEWIDDYLNERLDLTARRQVDERLRTDTAFRRQVEDHRRWTAQLHLYGERKLREQMRLWDEELASTKALEPVVRPLWQRPLAYGAVASVAAGVALIWLLRTPAEPDAQPNRSPLRTLKLPIEKGIAGLGYASDSLLTDSVWVQVQPGRGREEQYRFTDTLYLYSNRLSDTANQLHLVKEPASGRYRLVVADSLTFRLERGFRQPRPLLP